MEWIVLGLLLLGDMTIYQLNSSFNQGLSLIYSASYGTLQYAVKKLLIEKRINFTERIDNGRKKKIYSINPAGKAAFQEWMRSEITSQKMETTILARLYFMGLLESKEERIRLLEDMVVKASGALHGLQKINLQYREIDIPEEAEKIARYQLKTLDYGIMAHSAAVDWLKRLLAEEKNRD
jgi:PadR family transcriptional regulator AphA